MGPLESVPCPLCGSGQVRSAIERVVGLTVGECADCGLAYVSPRPTQAAMERHYASGYMKPAADVIRTARTVEACGLLEPDIERLQRFVQIEGAAALDIGCGPGLFLRALQRAGAATLVGIEPSRDQPLAAVHDGIEILRSTFETAAVSDGAFDLVVCNDVLEHVYDCHALADFIARKLRAGGICFLRTPNWGAVRRFGASWRGLAVDYEHLQYFDRGTLSALLERHGIVPLRFDFEAAADGLGHSAQMRGAGASGMAALAQTALRSAIIATPVVNRAFYRALGRYRRRRAKSEISSGTAHEIIVIGRKVAR